MRSRLIAFTLLAATVVPSLALAQTTPAPSTTTTTTTVSTTSAGQWRASKLVGVNVYNEQNEKLGDISEILIDTTGKVTGVVIGVGGFLGVGQRDILVTLDKLRFVNEPVRTNTATNTTTGAPATTGSTRTDAAGNTTTRTTATTTGHRWYPDHAVMAGATKESLKSMTEFKYD